MKEIYKNGDNIMLLYKIVLLKKRIDKVREELDSLIKEGGDYSQVLTVSQKLDALIVNYTKIKGEIKDGNN
ncbi:MULTISPECIES: aspartyl-phosphate phosphatase Spo0E family protein [Thermoanaerobacterium]|uniref:Spo0E like sporulation regulatory protein n=3 Tax=Thermoanaerobacterium TaxID=28895 RepID=L0IQ98_THETR|nr:MULTISPECIES: aspartyl-phosphate phosphatase Spo0E family protein [Thermoanaerobacterium]AFK94345.1 Sporulation stage 0, Spo0E-like regulatory phosphatase [Thermoanaerobacterium saccharolyticum JW/SL-YS485]AGB20381.1 Spo0E like sporulation regulatory protein [Thermoanaerobacterium thermosaccharolyticum M0795]ETO39115.1 sporulation stage 0, Spo0E-like regulatory phosphatase [Thermoanaerobacterium aotearoense SCUT27]